MKKIIEIIITELFYILTVAWLAFNLLEFLWPRLVLSYINLNLILIFWLIAGIFIIVDKQMATDLK